MSEVAEHTGATLTKELRAENERLKLENKKLDEAWRDEIAAGARLHDQVQALQYVSPRANGHLLIEAEPPKERYELHWLLEALEPKEPLQFVVEGVFLEGSMNQVIGEPGSKKTYLLIDALIAVATGGTWLGRATTQGPALFIDEESGRRRLERRIAAITAARHAPEDTPLAYVTLAQFNLREEQDVQSVRQLVEETGAKFVVIDAMADVMPGADENAVKDVQPVLMALRKMAEETRAAIVLIHHTNKNGGYRGSSAISGAVDLMLKVESKSGSPDVDVTSVKARDGGPVKLAAHIRFEDDKVFVNEAEFSDREQPLSAGEEYVLRYLNEHGASSMKAITDSADTCAGGTAKNAVYDLVKVGKVERVDDGGPGMKAVFDIRREKAPDANYRLPYKE